MRKLTSLTAALGALMLAGCNGCPGKTACDLTTPTLSTRVVVTSITAPPGGGSTREFEVVASGFHPNAAANLGIANYPKSSGSILETVTMNAGGGGRWTRFAPLLLATDPDYEPDVDVTTTVVEAATTCFAIAKTKHRDFAKLF